MFWLLAQDLHAQVAQMQAASDRNDLADAEEEARRGVQNGAAPRPSGSSRDYDTRSLLAPHSGGAGPSNDSSSMAYVAAPSASQALGGGAGSSSMGSSAGGGGRGDDGGISAHEVDGYHKPPSAPRIPRSKKWVWWRALKTPEVRSELALGLGLQALQQLSGINTVLYYLPAILELGGFRNKRTVLLVSLLPAAINALGTVVGAVAIDRYGRRPLMLWSLSAVVVALALLGGAFFLAEHTSPGVTPAVDFGGGLRLNSTCDLSGVSSCSECLMDGCGFCAVADDTGEPGTCMSLSDHDMCDAEWLEKHAVDSDGGVDDGAGGLAPPSPPPATPREALSGLFWYFNGCPSPNTPWIIVGLMVYLAVFAPGVGPVPWAINAEIYPVEVSTYIARSSETMSCGRCPST